ncbi:MAG: EAL domain-containing protein [Eubacterium sp.]|nr:EAL domain-containing protein [Eubacterium sp.]
MQLDTGNQKMIHIIIEFSEGFPLIINPYTDDEIRYGTLNELVHPDDIPNLTKMFSEFSGLNRDSIEAHCRLTVGGDYHRFFISCRALAAENGRLTGFEGAMLDLTAYLSETSDRQENAPDSETVSVKGGESLEDIFGKEYLLSLQRPFSGGNVFSGIYAPDGRLICAAKGPGGKKHLNDYPYTTRENIRVNHVECGSWVLGAKSEELLNDNLQFWETLVQTLSRMANAFAALLGEMENSRSANKLLGQNMEEQILLNNIYAIITESPTALKALEGVTELVGDYFRLDRICIGGLSENGGIDRIWCRDRTIDKGMVDKEKRNRQFFGGIANDLKSYAASFSSDTVNEFAEQGVKAYALFSLFDSGDSDSVISFEMLDNEHNWTQRERKQLRNISQIISSILMRISAQEKLDESRKELSRLAFYDSIFNTPNRAKLSGDLSALLERSVSGAVIAFKIANTRNLSALYGHSYSDMLLRSVAEYLSKLPIKDIGVYYFSNAIFMINLPGCGSDGAKKVAETLIYRFSLPWEFRGGLHNLKCCMGIAFYPSNGKNADDICKAASVAMYRAREFRKNSYTFYSGTLESSRTAAGSMEHRITESINNGMEGFSLKFQPIFIAGSGEIACCECLVRFNDPLYGNIPNSTLFPLAESLGLSNAIDGWVTEKACRFCKEVQDSGFPDFKVSVNLTAEELKSATVIKQTERALKASGLSPEYLVLEIPVKANLPYNDNAGVLTDLKRLGVRVGIDSYGSENISLKMLKNPYLDVISIPQQLLSDVGDEFDRILTESVISLAHCSNLKICIKGIENEEQLAAAEKSGADRVQGYYCSKPMDGEQMKEALMYCRIK